jgi:hypothetical protein
MKEILLGIIFMIVGVISYCQNSFEIQIRMQNYQAPGDIVIDDQGNYVIAGASLDLNANIYSGIIIKISSTGHITDSLTYSVSDSSCLFSNIVKLDGNYLVFGGIGSLSSGLNSLMICSYDFDLDFQWRKNYKLSGTHVIGEFNVKIDLDSNIVLIGTASKADNYLDTDPFEFRCNQEGDSIEMVLESLDYIQMIFDFLIKPDSNGYISFGYGQYPSYPSYHSCGIFYSSDFYREVVKEIPDDRFHSSHTTKWVNDSEFLISGKRNITIQNTLVQGVGLKKMDTSFSILKEVDVAHILDTICYPGWDQSFDYKNIDNIFFTWNKNYDDWFQNMPSWIVLTKYDSNFTQVYNRYFGGDVMYSSYRINVTEDGGCIILGIRYDYTIPGYDYDLYLIKTDENGLVTAIDEDQLQSKLNILVYPNPCSERISIDHDLTLVDIFDHSGQLVLRFQNYNQFSDIAVGQLQSGVYIYRALSKEGGYASGKFVKR